VKAHHYTLKSKWTQDVWYDEQQRLVHASLVASDGSVILYQLLSDLDEPRKVSAVR
jgi:hypothetical protein